MMLVLVAACGLSFASVKTLNKFQRLLKPSIPLSAITSMGRVAQLGNIINSDKSTLGGDSRVTHVKPVSVKYTCGVNWYLAGVNYENFEVAENELLRTHTYLRARFKDLYAGREPLLLEAPSLMAVEVKAKKKHVNVSAVMKPKRSSVNTQLSIQRSSQSSVEERKKVPRTALQQSKSDDIDSIDKKIHNNNTLSSNASKNKHKNVELLVAAAEQLTSRSLYEYAGIHKREIPKLDQLINREAKKEESAANAVLNKEVITAPEQQLLSARALQNRNEPARAGESAAVSTHMDTHGDYQNNNEYSALTTVSEVGSVMTYTPPSNSGGLGSGGDLVANNSVVSDASPLVRVIQSGTTQIRVSKVVETQKAVEYSTASSETSNEVHVPQQTQNSGVNAVEEGTERGPEAASLASASKSIEDSGVTRTAVQKYSGHVLEAFSAGNQGVPGASIQILGSDQIIYSDQDGRFEFENVRTQGVLPVRISKEGYRWRSAELRRGNELRVELLNENAARVLEVATNTSYASGGIVFAELIDPERGPLDSYRMSLVSTNEVGHRIVARYLDANGTPNSQWQQTSSRGQAIFVGVPEGTYIMSVVNERGEEMAPHILHVSVGEAVISKYSLGQNVNVSLMLMNGQTQNAGQSGLRAQVFGHSTTAISDRNGRVNLGRLRIDCNALNYVQIEGTNLYRNRAEYRCQSEQNIYVIAAEQVESAATESGAQLSPLMGLLIGHVSSRSPLRAQLLGPDEVTPSEVPRGLDFYYDDTGSISASQDKTTNSGNYAIFNAPTGLSYIQFFSEDGLTKYMTPVLLSPSTVNTSIR